VSRYLNRTSADWKPTSNKAQLRNMLRKHIQDSGFLETGVHNIVDQVVGPKIQQINPEVENILYTMFGMEKPDSNDEEEEMMEDNTAKSEEKLSNISSGSKYLLIYVKKCFIDFDLHTHFLKSGRAIGNEDV
jgi:hypothetical protein